MITYDELIPSIGSKIFMSIIELFINNSASLPCSCIASKIIYKYRKHIVTGNLNFIEGKDLRNILAKGPNCRQNQIR